MRARHFVKVNFSFGLSTECKDDAHFCIPNASCVQSELSDGYLCQCPAGTIGNGFQLEKGGDGCDETCSMFGVECDSTKFTITLDEKCKGVSVL